MKIIGKSNDGFILDASKQEVARLLGYYSFYGNENKVNIGDDITVNDMFETLYKMKRVEDELTNVSKTLAAISKTVLLPIPLIKNATNEEKDSTN